MSSFKKLYTETPLIRSEPLSKLAKTDVYLKLDNLQESGSFKDRGMSCLIQNLASQNIPGIISSSGGNAGLAAAMVAQKLKLPCRVVVPKTTKSIVVQKLQHYGAKVQIVGNNWNEADMYVQSQANLHGLGYISPYEDPLLWQGHSSLVDEIYTALHDVSPSHLIVSVGGGGLLCGVLEKIRKSTQLIAAETIGADSFHQAVKAGRVVPLDGITSVATSLGATSVSRTALERALQHNVQSCVCTDQQAIDAILQFAQHHRMLVEPACGAALAVVYSGLVEFKGPVVIEVCGGSGVNLELLQSWKQQFGL